MTILKGYIIGALYAVICLLLARLLYKLGVSKKYTRKLVHILIGFEWIILNYFIGASYHLVAICLSFLVLLLVVYKKRLMPMLASDADNAPGTVYFCLSMGVMALFAAINSRFMIPFGIAVFCTSLGDGFAGVVGQLVIRGNPKIWKNKTLLGTLSSFVFSLCVCLAFDFAYELALPIWTYFAVSLFAAVLELVTERGFDNVTLPLGVFLLLSFFLYSADTAAFYIVPIILTPLMLAVVVTKKILTPTGVVFALLLDAAVVLAFGNVGFIMMATFLVGGVLIDKIKRKKGAVAVFCESKNDKTRDAYQVLANGFSAFLISLAYLIEPHPVFLVAFAAAAAEAFSDTCASGVGSLSKNTYDVFKLRKIEKGMSGGMSLIGTVASLIGAFAVSAVPLLFGAYDFGLVVVVFVCAFGGAVFDSLLGSLLQAKYKCSRCGAFTESTTHCSKPGLKVSGASFVDNDTVNYLSGIFSVLISILMYFFIFN